MRSRASTSGSSTRVDANVHIGGYLAAADPGHVRARGITHILKLFGDDARYYGGRHRHPGVEYLIIDAEDHPNYPLGAHFAACLAFIQGAIRAQGQVLVHCHAGVSRSAAVVLVHLMVNAGYPLPRAWVVLKARRRVVRPNAGFWRLLVETDARIRRLRDSGRAPLRPRL